MPPVAIDLAWLWETKATSDVTLRVYPYHETGDGKPEPVANLRLHCAVVASTAIHFRPRIHGSWQHADPEAQPAVKRRKALATEGKMLELTCFPGERHTVPEAVMRHAYTGVLPDEPEELAWMIRRAGYLVMHATVEACTAKLKELSDGGKLTLQHVIAISSLPGLLTCEERHRPALQQAVTSMAAKVLSAQFGSARQVLVDQQLLDQFVRLPFQLLKQWARMRSLQVDSENTMAVLITAWYDQQLVTHPTESGGESDSNSEHQCSWSARTGQQCQELSALVCLNKLTPSFHLQAIPHLKWYRATGQLTEQHAVVRALAAIHADSMTEAYKEALASGSTARQQQGPAKAQQQWSLRRQQLVTLWAFKSLSLGPGIYLGGFTYTVDLLLTQAAQGVQDEYTLGLFFKVQWPEPLIKHGVGLRVPQPVSAVRVRMQVRSATALHRTLLVGAAPSPCSGLGMEDVAGRSFSGSGHLMSFFFTAAARPCITVSLEAL